MSRSAKSVACSRLNVIGVSAFFFLPVLAAALTSADEFHSVTNTRCPSAISHFASSPSCVVLPEPSIPSTTNSFPGYSCGFVRLFNMSLPADLHSERLADHALERRGLPVGRPQLQFGVAGGQELQQHVVAAIVELDPGDRLRMTAIEVLGQAQYRRERAYDPTLPAAQSPEILVPNLRHATSMILRNEGNGFDLVRFEAPPVVVPD